MVYLSWRGSEGDLGLLFSSGALSTTEEFARGFLSPARSAEFLQLMVRPLIETVCIAVVGLSLAVVIALPLSFAAAYPDALGPRERPNAWRRLLFAGARGALNIMRSVPELIWALLFVRALGIGALPGVLAIAVGYGGVLGKVYAEIFESTPRGPARAFMIAGAGSFRAFIFGVVPSAAPLLTSYTLYRLDCALRASAILGVVGAGGLGQQLDLSLKMFAYDEVATLVIVLFALVAVVDHLSSRLRSRLIDKSTFLPQSRRSARARVLVLAGWGALVVGAGAFLGLEPAALFSAESLSSMARFARELFPPELSGQLVWDLLPKLGETLAVSLLGTALACVAALLLAFGANPRIAADAGGTNKLLVALLRVRALVCQGLMNIGRTLPELVWALVFILILGLGPFAGALALAIHTAGVLARLYSEVLQELPPGAYRAQRQLGASRLAATLFGDFPRAFPQLVAYTLYRWEVNIRASATLGVVGAGGLGTELHLSLSLFDFHRTATLVLALIVLVMLVDALSGWIRRQVLPATRREASHRSAPAAALEAEIEGQRFMVLELSLRAVRLYARRHELELPPETPFELLLDVGDTEAIACQARVRAAQNDEAGSWLDLSLSPCGLWEMWRLYRVVGRGQWSAGGATRAAVI